MRTEPESIEPCSDHFLAGIPVMSFDRAGDVVRVGPFPSRWSAHILLTESGLWSLWIYQGSLVKRREHG